MTKLVIKKEERNFPIIPLIFLLILATLIGYYLGHLGTLLDSKVTIEDNTSCQSLDETLFQIEKNCGTTHITHRFGSNDWFIFKPVCIADGYCKYDYVPLEECSKE